jgi:hypothetical protein
MTGEESVAIHPLSVSFKAQINGGKYSAVTTKRLNCISDTAFGFVTYFYCLF